MRVERLTACVLLVISAVTSAFASPSIDARVFDGNAPAVTGDTLLGQSFRANAAGSVDTIGLELFRFPSSSAPVSFTLVETVAGVPTLNPASVVASLSIPLSQIPVVPVGQGLPQGSLTIIDLQAFDIAVEAGDELAIILSSSNSSAVAEEFVLWTAGVETFGGGTGFFSPGAGTPLEPFSAFLGPPPEFFDFGFTVNVIPSPAASVALALGLAVVRTRRS